jgi:hypothetical protein
MVASARYKELYDCSGNRQFQAPLVETVRAGVYSETPSDVAAALRNQTLSAPYQRATYFAERISQWRGLEPCIPHHDYRDIERLYHRYTNKWGLYPNEQRWQPDYCLSKEDTRQLLWEIDRQRMSDGLKPYFVKKYLVSLLPMCWSMQVLRISTACACERKDSWLMEGSRLQSHSLCFAAFGTKIRPRSPFVIWSPTSMWYYMPPAIAHSAPLFLQEKFLTIRLQLCGRGSLGLRINDYLVLRLKELFKQLQVPFAQLAERTGRRHSFISYNFVFRRLFDLLGCSHLGADFPPLKSRKKREDIVSIWIDLIIYLRWPYLNSDAQLYGASHAIEVFALQHNRGAAQPPRKRARKSDPVDSNHRLRQPRASGASEPHTWGDSDAGLLELCAALYSAARVRAGGAGDGDCVGLGNELF